MLGHKHYLWLVPTLAAVVAAWAGWLSVGQVALDVGAPSDGSYLVGFFDREQNEFGTYRWSGPAAQIRLPTLRGSAVLELWMAQRPGGARLTVGQDGRSLSSFELRDGPPRRYQVLLGRTTAASGATTISLLGAAAAQTESEPRPIVALVYSAGIAAQPGTSLPPAQPLLLIGTCAVLAYTALLLAGVRSWALPLATLSGAALGLAWGWARLAVAPHLIPLTIGLSTIAALMAGLRAGVRHSARLTTPELFALFAATSALIPLYMYVDFGLDSWLHWHNLPILLLPLGLALLWLRDRTRVIVAGLVLLVSAAYAAGMLYTVFSGDFARDFAALFRGARRLVQATGPLYLLDEIRANPLSETFKYPPPFVLLMAPLTSLAFVPAFMIWKIANFLTLLGAGAALLHVYRIPLRSWAGAGLLLLLFSMRPLTDTLAYGQVDLIILLLVTLGLAAVMRRADLFYGIWIGLAAALKLYPAYLLGFALVRGRWRALLGALAAGGALGGLSLLLLGWEVHWSFLRDVLPATGVGTSWVENQTFNGFLNRLLAPDQIGFHPDGGGAVRLATYGWALALTALTAWLTRPAGGLRPDIGCGLWIVAMLLILPAAWMHYEVLLLIPFFQAFVLAHERDDRVPWRAAACYALAWMLLAHGNLWTFFDKTLHGPFWQLILSYKFYGMLLLYGAIVLTNARAGASVAVPARPQPLRASELVKAEG